MLMLVVVVARGLQMSAPLMNKVSPLALPLSELTEVVGGSGRAKSIWDSLKKGVDPLAEDGLLTKKTREALESLGLSDRLVPAVVESATVAEDGTTKLLVRFNDGLAVETVLIPHATLPRTTLCVSTQVGCDRGCAFCATARMGLVRNLTASEIAAQYFCALPYGRDASKPLSNVVLFGMGDAGVNCVEAAAACAILTDDQRFNLARAKVTASTVGPNPEVFKVLAAAPCMLAWSVHSPNDALRKQLVPTHAHFSAVDLRQGLVEALSSRPTLRTRTLMVTATLIEGINDSDQDAKDLALFIKPLVDVAIKLNVDLIPVNPVDHATHFKRPSFERVSQFADVVRQHEPRVHVAVRVTRGDDQNAACGQLLIRQKQQRPALLLQ